MVWAFRVVRRLGVAGAAEAATSPPSVAGAVALRVAGLRVVARGLADAPPADAATLPADASGVVAAAFAVRVVRRLAAGSVTAW